MKLGIISQWTTPDLSRIPADILQGHLDGGGTAKVLTGFPNYPHGKYHSDAKEKATEVIGERFTMLRVPSHIAKNGGAWERIRSFLSFATSSIRHSNYLNDVDILYVYATPMTSAMAALKLRLLRQIPYVLHVQDIWPESVTDSGMIKNRYIKSLMNTLINMLLLPVYRLATQVIVISPSAKPLLVSRGVKRSKITVVYNWHESPMQGLASMSKPSVIDAAQEETNDVPLRVVYAGNIGHMQDLQNLIRAAALVRNEPRLRIYIYGSGVQEQAVRCLAEELRVDNVDFCGRVGRREMAEVYAASDFQLVLLKDSNIFRSNIPSKFQAALAHGRPIITTVAGDLAELCKTASLGIAAEPESPRALAAALKQAVSMSADDVREMGLNAERFYRSNLMPLHGVSKIREILVNSCKIDPEGTNK